MLATVHLPLTKLTTFNYLNYFNYFNYSNYSNYFNYFFIHGKQACERPHIMA